MMYKKFFSPIFRESLKKSWQMKSWWLLGFLSLFVGGSLTYQVTLKGILSLSQPDLWQARWNSWFVQGALWQIVKGQFSVLLADPKAWIVLVFVWLVILAIGLLMFLLSSYGVSSIFSAVKIQEKKDTFPFLLVAWMGKKYVIKTFLIIFSLWLLSNAALFVFSIPVVFFGSITGGTSDLLVSVAMIILFVAFSFLFAIISIFATLYVIVEDMKIFAAYKNAFNLFKRHWLVSIEMGLLQSLFAIVITLLIGIATSLITVPLIIIALAVVSNGSNAIVALLPQFVIYVLLIVSIITGSIFSLFQLYSWGLLFLQIDEVQPHSRLVYLAEEKILKPLFQ